jgi:glycosyltransferase involved in cell wall biosynthesis
MRIAQIAPLIERVPPKLYGGTERIVAYLTDALVRLGHEVTLFASGDSRTLARLVPCSREALRLDPTVRDQLPYGILQLEVVRQRADSFDVLHFHTDYFHFPLFRGTADRTVTTLHGRLDLPDLVPLFREFSDMPLVSISDDQRRPMPPGVRWLGTVHHGLPHDLLRLEPVPQGGYLAFLGRISPEKRPDLAVEIAKRAGVPLKIFAKVDRADERYFREEIAPLLDHPLVDFVGEIDDVAKQRALGDALALLFPIDWPEPFGITMIEAMACGTPVIAFRRGSVPEVLEHGLTGFIVEGVEEAAAAVAGLDRLDRRTIRRRFEERFTAERMARDYVALYEQLAALRARDPAGSLSVSAIGTATAHRAAIARKPVGPSVP